MAEPEEWEFASLRWIHQVREAEYHKTKDRPIGTWLKPVDPKEDDGSLPASGSECQDCLL